MVRMNISRQGGRVRRARTRTKTRWPCTPSELNWCLHGLKTVTALILYTDWLYFLLQLANDRDEFGVPPVIFALQNGQGDVVRYLVEAGADVNAQEARTLRTPLHYALYTKNIKIFQFLLG